MDATDALAVGALRLVYLGLRRRKVDWRVHVQVAGPERGPAVVVRVGLGTDVKVDLLDGTNSSIVVPSSRLRGSTRYMNPPSPLR